MIKVEPFKKIKLKYLYYIYGGDYYDFYYKNKQKF